MSESSNLERQRFEKTALNDVLITDQHISYDVATVK